MKRRLILALTAFLGACVPSPEDRAVDICRSALEGVPDADGNSRKRCMSDVLQAGFDAQEAAAQKYRDLPRRWTNE